MLSLFYLKNQKNSGGRKHSFGRAMMPCFIFAVLLIKQKAVLLHANPTNQRVHDFSLFDFSHAIKESFFVFVKCILGNCLGRIKPQFTMNS